MSADTRGVSLQAQVSPQDYNPFLPVFKTQAMGKYRLISPGVTVVILAINVSTVGLCEMT